MAQDQGITISSIKYSSGSIILFSAGATGNLVGTKTNMDRAKYR